MREFAQCHKVGFSNYVLCSLTYHMPSVSNRTAYLARYKEMVCLASSTLTVQRYLKKYFQLFLRYGTCTEIYGRFCTALQTKNTIATRVVLLLVSAKGKKLF